MINTVKRYISDRVLPCCTANEVSISSSAGLPGRMPEDHKVSKYYQELDRILWIFPLQGWGGGGGGDVCGLCLWTKEEFSSGYVFI